MIDQLIHHLPYLGVVLLLIAGGLGAPIPEDIPLLLGGYYCGTGRADLAIMLPLTFFAVLLGDSMVFMLGRRYGHHVPSLPGFRRYLSPERMNRARDAFHEHSGKTLFTARFMPGLRLTVYFSAGTFGIPMWRMLFWDGLAAALSVPVWVLLAWHFADDLQRVKRWAFGTQAALVTLLVIAGTTFLLWKWMRRRRLASAG